MTFPFTILILDVDFGHENGDDSHEGDYKPGQDSDSDNSKLEDGAKIQGN